MSTMTLLYFAIAVFVTMGIGLILTALEFRKIADASVDSGDSSKAAAEVRD